MDWLSQNGFWVFIFVAFMAIHLFGHGGHSQRQERPDAGKEGKKDSNRQQHHHH